MNNNQEDLIGRLANANDRLIGPAWAHAAIREAIEFLEEHGNAPEQLAAVKEMHKRQARTIRNYQQAMNLVHKASRQITDTWKEPTE